MMARVISPRHHFRGFFNFREVLNIDANKSYPPGQAKTPPATGEF
jgi:hypothetical protein